MGDLYFCYMGDFFLFIFFLFLSNIMYLRGVSPSADGESYFFLWKSTKTAPSTEGWLSREINFVLIVFSRQELFSISDGYCASWREKARIKLSACHALLPLTSLHAGEASSHILALCKVWVYIIKP